MPKLFNPLTRDFTVTYDIHENGQPEPFTIHAQEIETFEEPIFSHLKKHLGYELAMQIKGRGSYEDAFKKAEGMMETKDNG